MLTNYETIRAFLMGDEARAHSLSVRAVGNEAWALFSYAEPIARAQRCDSGALCVDLNLHKYSQTTSQHQSAIQGALAGLASERGAWQTYGPSGIGPVTVGEIGGMPHVTIVERDELRKLCGLDERPPAVSKVGRNQTIETATGRRLTRNW
jgi:hypothetical protein